MPQTKGVSLLYRSISFTQDCVLIGYRTVRFLLMQTMELISGIDVDNGFQKLFMYCAKIRNGSSSET